MSAADIAKAFLAEVLAKVPESHRASVEAAFNDPTAAPALEVLGAGVSRQSDYSRNMDQLAAQRRQLDAENARVAEVATKQREWWETVKPIAELGEKAQAAGWNPDTPTTGAPPVAPTVPADVVRTADLERREREAVTFNAFTTTLSQKHAMEFGEVLDLPALVDEATRNRQTLQQAYDVKFGPKYQEKAQKATDLLIEQRVKEGVAAALKGVHNPNFPVAPDAMQSPLDALAPSTPGVGVDDLVDEYHRVVAGARA